MIDLSPLEELAHTHFSQKHEARERSLIHSRLVIRRASTAIRALHRHEFSQADELLAEARTEIATISTDLAGLPELFHHNYITDALKEYAEAVLTLAFVRNEAPPLPEALAVGYVAYFNGLAESVGELRRFTLDALRSDDLETGERLLAIMDSIYELLITLDYPDAVTGALRRQTDSVRGILEKTRGDLTTATSERRLSQAVEALRARLTP